MRTSFVLPCLLAVLTLSFGRDPDPAPAPAAAIPPPTELQQLQQKFARRRAVALRPVSAWYRGQLEILQKKLFVEAPGSEAEVAKVLQATKETFWQEDQPELAQALIRSHWLWRSDYDPRGVTLTFHPDGTADHLGLHGTWRITGPSEVTVFPQDDDPYTLRFNTSLTSYECDQHHVGGIRLPPTP